MRFVYVLINIAILVVILVLAGRKSVRKIFAGRRERLDASLTEAETPLTLDPLPPAPAVKTPLEAERRAAEDAGARSLAVQDESLARAEEDRRREMLLRTRTAFAERIVEKTREIMSGEAYLANVRDRKAEVLENVLDHVRITPGDRAYLTRTGKLYVTLTSAEPLPKAVTDRVEKRTTEMVKAAGGEISFWVREDPSLIGGVRLRVGDTIYEYSIANELYRLRKKLNERPLTETDAASMEASFLETARAVTPSIDVFQVGRVISTADGICWLDGVSDIMYSEVVELSDGQRAMAMDIQPDRVGCMIFGSYDHIESYSSVRRLNTMASVPVGEAMLGRVVDALGNPIDGKGRIWTQERRPVEFGAPAIPDRQSVSVPLHTGIKAIDALVPIGRGQRELIIGDRQTGKTAIAVDAILSQKGKDVVCIYVAIGQKRTTVAEIADRLEQSGALAYTTIVSATASDSASLQYIAPFAGCAMGEYFMYRGRDVLIVYDDLSKHAVAYRELSLLLHRPSGREAYPGDIFYLHSRLLERAARLSPEAGGGSITALPIIETQAGDISAYIPTNVISITDGQIFLETDLFNEGQRPAVNVGLSVSRVGGSAQTGIMKQVASRLRTSLAQYRELAAFTQFGADLDDATKKVLASGSRMMAALRQDRFAPLADWEQALIIHCVAGGHADRIEPEEMERYTAALLAWFPAEEPALAARMATGKKLSDGELADLNAALARFAEAQ